MTETSGADNKISTTIMKGGSDDVPEQLIFEIDVISNILGFLSWKEILCARVCRKWRAAAKVTEVPESYCRGRFGSLDEPELFIRNRAFACALEWISDALPRIRTINFGRPDDEFDIADGEDPRIRLQIDWEALGLPPAPPPVDISPIGNFRTLRNLFISHASLNGSYPFLFNFPQLRTLKLTDVGVKWDLEMLSNLPKLEKLRCIRNYGLRGKLKSIRVLQSHLVELTLAGCEGVEGDLTDIADFPLLEELSLVNTNITGDIRKIGPADFKSIKRMDLGDKVYGGDNVPSIQDAPTIMLTWYYLKKRNSKIFDGRRLGLPLESPERYDIHGHHSRAAPLYVEFVKAGPRMGWRWTNCVSGGSCETHWLDPAPEPSDDGYDAYIQKLNDIENDVDFYQGYLVPPTPEEHRQRSFEIPLDPILATYSNNSFGVW